jgi:Ca-activated chloride channel family protein
VAEKMGELFRQLDRPALTDVEVAWGDPGAETYPSRIPDLYFGEPVVVAARMIVPPGGEVRLTGATGGTPWEVVVPALAASERAGIDKLWARRKIAALSGRMTLGGDGENLDVLRAGIVDLGLAHHLVTEFTSLVAVDTTPTAPAGERPRTTLLPVNVPAGWEGGFQHVALPQGGTSARLDLLVGLLLLAAGAFVVLRLRAQWAEAWS